MPTKTKRDEIKWGRAKAIAEKQGKGDNWGLVMKIYQGMNPDYEFKTGPKAKSAAEINVDDAARNIFKGIPPDDGQWHGGPPRIGTDVTSPEVKVVKTANNPDGTVTTYAIWTFGQDDFNSSGIVVESFLFKRFMDAYPNGAEFLIDALAEVVQKQSSKLEKDLTEFFAKQTWKPFSALVGYKEASDWEDIELVRVADVAISKVMHYRRWDTVWFPVTVKAVIKARKKPDVTHGPFTVMSDKELDTWIAKWEDAGPENFWMDGELNVSRPAAYAMYRKRWRDMRPREQADMMESLQHGRLASLGQWRVALEAENFVEAGFEPLSMLLAFLRAAHQAHWTGHWQSKGTVFYADHQLLDRLYNAIIPEIDGLAEKLVAKYGVESVDLTDQLGIMADLAEEWGAEPNLLVRAQMIETTLQNVIANALEATTDVSLGMDNFLAGVADSHETALYLLGQRLAEGKMAAKVAAKHKFDEAKTLKAVGEHIKANDPDMVKNLKRQGEKTDAVSLGKYFKATDPKGYSRLIWDL